MKQLTAVAMSGGVDSLAAAYLLKKQGCKLIGIHFTTGYETISGNAIVNQIKRQLDIKVEIIDCAVEFKQKVVDYFTQSYQNGKTPNPCIVCNSLIKFGTIFDFARKLGASRFATGHYSQIAQDKKGIFHLLKGVDSVKDQSYFLAFLTQHQLANACFPLGNMKKSQVMELSQKLSPVIKKESQDICFIKSGSYGKFLEQKIDFKSGLIKDVNGNILGRHKGLHLFTVGQRRGINCPASEPYYVKRIDNEKNLLIVCRKEDLLSSKCKVVKINWIDKKQKIPVKVHTRIRYRHNAVESTLFPIDEYCVIVEFKIPQTAITPGQAAVFYKYSEVIGGGWIETMEKKI